MVFKVKIDNVSLVCKGHFLMLFKPKLLMVVFFVFFLVVGTIYSNGINQDFIFDDYENIVNNYVVHIDAISYRSLMQAAFSTKSGPLRRPVSMLSFALNYYLSGLNPSFFKIVNIFIHLLCSVIVFALSKQILWHLNRQYPSVAIKEKTVQVVCVFSMFMWALHPLNLTSVLYVVQRMTSLSAFFAFFALCSYLWGRKMHAIGARGGWLCIFASVFVLIPLSVLSKENGALTIFLLGACEVVLVRFYALHDIERKKAKLFFILVCIVPFIITVSYFIFNSQIYLGGYSSRDFSLEQRVLTEFRVIMLYLQLTVLPSLKELTLFHDDIDISIGLFKPIGTAYALATIMALLTTAVWARKKHPVLVFALIFYFIGHSMESTIFPLEIAHEHRNYLPIYALIFAFAYYVIRITENRAVPALGKILLLVIVVYFAKITNERALNWSNPVKHVLFMVKSHPNSFRSNYEAARIHYLYYLNEVDSDNRKSLELLIREWFQKCIELKPHRVIALLGMVQLDAVSGRKTPNELLGKLFENLERSKVTVSAAAAVKQLNKCQMMKKCTVADHVIERIMKSLVSNKLLSTSQKASIFNQLSIRYLSYNDIESAEKFSRMAVDTHPAEPQYWLNYLSLLIASDDKIMAQSVIDRAKMFFMESEQQIKLDKLQIEINRLSVKKIK